MGIRIAGIGAYTPEKVLSNAELEKIVDTSDEWISSRTGIKERRIAKDSEATSDLASSAALNALEMAGFEPDDLDIIIAATITSDKVFPSTACIVQKKIKASRAFCFDLQAACSGLLYSMETARCMLTANPNYKRILVIGAEKLSSIVDWEDRATCVLFGDGASAVILEKTDDDKNCFLGSHMGSDGNYEDILHIEAGGSAMPPTKQTLEERRHFLTMNGQEVFKLAVNAMVGSCRKTMEECGVSADQIKWLVPHQANYRILKAVATRLGIPEERVYMNVDRFGNTSAASIGLCLDEIKRKNVASSGDYLLLTAFGGGLTWAAILLEWE
jgi:3-oxoacyl-[acyl-carrier-protein] synthase-3